MESSISIDSWYQLDNPEEILPFLERNPGIIKFLETNVKFFKKNLHQPMILFYTNEKVCDCMKDDEVLWMFLNQNEDFNMELENKIFNLVSDAYYETKGMLCFSSTLD